MCLSFLVVALLCRSLVSSALLFPKDLSPINTADLSGILSCPWFRGLISDNDTAKLGLDFQRMLKLNHTLFTAARDHVYVFDLRRQTKDALSPDRHLTWKTQDMQNCAMRGKLQDECYNYIKVLVPKNDGTLIACGTNSFNPMCRTYKISTLEHEGEELNGQARCPFDAKQTNVALFTDGNLYSATVADFQASDTVVYRSLGEKSPVLRTVKYDSKWLREPHFLHAVEFGHYVYFFLREISMEYTTLGRVIFSRVARVCKNDMGGSPRVLEKYWTSFLKARLNCSMPGDSFFYFDVLQAVTNIVQVNNRPAVIGVFTTQANSITGSGVCAFYMDDIEKAFNGRFKEQKTAESAWTPIPEDKVPKPRPGSCAGFGKAAAYKTSSEFPDEMLTFIKSYPLLDEAVPSILQKPWFTRANSRYKLTQLAADTAAGPYGNYTVLFLGSEDGKVLKVLAKTDGNSTMETSLLEEINVYSPSKCSLKSEDRKVLGLELDKTHNALFVAFSSCMVRMPLSRCEIYGSCKRNCFASRDPYCVWLKSGVCAHHSADLGTGFEQDIEQLKHLGSCQGVRQDAEAKESTKSVHFTFLIGCVFVAFVLGAFFSGLFVSCYCNHMFQKSKHMSKDPESSIQRPLSLKSLAKMNGLLDTQTKDGMLEASSPKLYTTLLPSEREQLNGLTKVGMKEHPELSGLPTPESTPELPMKNMKAIKNQWEKNQNCNNAKDSQLRSPIFHSPSSNSQVFQFSSTMVLPSTIHGYDPPLTSYLDEKKIPNSEHVLIRHSQCYLPKGVEVTTLDELLKHLHETNGSPRKLTNSIPINQQVLSPHSPISFGNRVQPKIPDTESAPYYSSSTLPRDSLPRRLDIPPDVPPQSCMEKQLRHPSQRHSLSSAQKLINIGPNSAMLSRQHSLSQATRQHPPPALLTRMHSTGSSVPLEGHNVFLSRQHSYTEQTPLPRNGMKRTTSLKPDMPPAPVFMPSSPVKVANPFNY
uniref:Semaphorin-6C isoform X3 n=1 Tax=Geotrypetes seraphini TaxID=260995 RepID=A0A6P8PHR4_GEOSA|nr:semaphorin-6C isoform X3 [Geotrypetes seraphini]